MFLEVSLREKDAGAVGAFEVTVVTGLLFGHSVGLFYVYEDFFTVEFGFMPVCLKVSGFGV
jgi:hypothetical protein